MKLPVSWMRDFAAVPDDPSTIAGRLGSCGFEVAGVDGDVVDFEITANRPDCLSVYGLAREAATAGDVTLAPAPDGPKRPGAAGMPVSIGDAGCGRYALALAKIKVAPSPAWLADRLQAAGVRPINNIVDITNYVMIEAGHPLHAFDVAKLSGPEIRVRRARAGEKLRTLDGIDRTLDDTMLVIADRESAVAVAGVMGGAASEVSSTTTHVAIESAWFLPSSVRATSRRLGLKTEASARFERGADLTAPVRVLRRVLALIEETGTGAVIGGISDVYPRVFEPRRVALSRIRLARLLGDQIPDADVARILGRLGFGVSTGPLGWDVTVPGFRVDVAREADLIEDVGRHWGFDRIPATFPALRSAPAGMAPGVERDRRLRRVLCGAGLQEACTFTFIEREAARPFAADADVVAIANPLSEKLAVLRPSILPGLLDAVIYSRRRETAQVRLFEIGAVVHPTGESSRTGWMLTGPRSGHWSGTGGDLDVFDATGVAELAGDVFGVTVHARPADRPWFVRGRAADLFLGEGSAAVCVGCAGEIRPDLVAARGLSAGGAVVGGEIDHAALAGAGAAVPARVTPLPRYPSVVRDVSIFVSDRLPAADLRGTIRSVAPPTLVSVQEFDRYEGQAVPEGMIGLSVRLTFRDRDRTLTDADVQRATDAIVAALVAGHGAVLRGRAD
jgi:phenylalanyl-tRNA synthetase beta chain